MEEKRRVSRRVSTTEGTNETRLASGIVCRPILSWYVSEAGVDGQLGTMEPSETREDWTSGLRSDSSESSVVPGPVYPADPTTARHVYFSLYFYFSGSDSKVVPR